MRKLCWLAILLTTCAACADSPPQAETSTTNASLAAPIGSYRAVIHKSELRSLSASAFPASVFAGTWRLQITPDAYRLTRPRFRVTEDLRAVPGRLSISATPAPVGAFNCYRNSDRLTEKGDAAASYDFESGATLALIAREDPCPLRRLLLERRWKVAG